MPQYAALTYTADVDWSAPEQAKEMAEYQEFSSTHGGSIRGGAAAQTKLSAREQMICKRLGPALRERGLLFVGIDVIDGYLTEINVTSPTGIRAIARIGGPDVAAHIIDVIEAKCRR